MFRRGAPVLALVLVVGGLVLPSTAAAIEATSRAGAPSPGPPKPPKPKVTKVKPASGPTGGGTKVTIKGEHLTGATKVTFGGIKGTKVKVKNDGKLTVLAPARSSGTVDVRVKTKGGKSKTGKKATFGYLLQPPTVGAISASSGPYTGGTRVTVTGTDFEQVSQVTFAGTPGTALTVLSPTQLAVTTPAHEAGAGPVTVTTSAGSGSASSPFTFVAFPLTITPPLPPGVTPGPAAEAYYDYVACPAVPLCFAVGAVFDGGANLPLIARRTAPGAWTAVQAPLPADASVPYDADFWDVDCASPTLCAAVGTYATSSRNRGLLLTWNGTAWSAQAISEPTTATSYTYVKAVDCPTTTACVAIGDYIDDTTFEERPLATSLSSGSWSAGISPPLPASTDEASLQDVSCLSPTQCVAVGSRIVTGNDQFPYIAALAGGVWQAAAATVPADAASDPGASLEGVSCRSTQCVAVGEYEDSSGDQTFVTRLAASPPGVWLSSKVPLPVGAAADPNAELYEVVCSSGTECRAVGNYETTGSPDLPLMVRVASGTPTAETGPLPPTTAANPQAGSGVLACRAVDTCAVPGFYRPADSLDGGFLHILGAGGWSAVLPPVPAGATEYYLNGLDYLGTAIVSVGSHSSVSNAGAGMIVELP